MAGAGACPAGQRGVTAAIDSGRRRFLGVTAALGAVAAGGLFAGWARPALAVPARMVTIGAAVTETVWALGAGDRIVAVDTTSMSPAEAQRLPKVGYMRTLAAEGVIATGATRVIADDGAGPASTLDQIRAAGIDLRMVTSATRIDQVEAAIVAVGDAIDLHDPAVALGLQVTAALAEVAEAALALPVHPSVMCLIGVGNAGLMAAGRDTAAAAVIRLAGGRNAFELSADYAPISAEAAAAMAPEVLAMPTHAIARLGGREAVLALPQLRLTPAAMAGRLIAIDSRALSGLGPSTADVATAFAADLAQVMG